MCKKILSFSCLLVLSGCTVTGDEPGRMHRADVQSALAVNDNCPVGCPSGGSSQTLFRKAYTLNNNPQQKLANWMAYKVTRAS